MGTHPIFESDFDCLTDLYCSMSSMSWGEYLQGGSGLMNHYQKIESCGIFGHNGSTWAQVGMDHTQQYYNEITDLVGLFTDPSSGYSKGFTLNNIQFALLRVEDDKIIHGKGKSPHTLPVTIQKTGQAVVIGLGEKDAVAGQVSKAVGKIADYIESVGY